MKTGSLFTRDTENPSHDKAGWSIKGDWDIVWISEIDSPSLYPCVVYIIKLSSAYLIMFVKQISGIVRRVCVCLYRSKGSCASTVFLLQTTLDNINHSSTLFNIQVNLEYVYLYYTPPPPPRPNLHLRGKVSEKGNVNPTIFCAQFKWI